MSYLFSLVYPLIPHIDRHGDDKRLNITYLRKHITNGNKLLRFGTIKHFAFAKHKIIIEIQLGKL